MLLLGLLHKKDLKLIILFVKIKDQSALSDELIRQIKKSIREACSPRHVPAKIIQVKDIPYTINGKKVEMAVKQIIQNRNVSAYLVVTKPLEQT